ncbi:alpha/beta fold hydrolase [Chitinophaga eiseniae]|uniref:Alpha/beta fold hydrolase n=1 Tax=Chitinophaga eiseniae TaxID=634771 RepID=A0A847SL78_9BACT|nr:alpha/beta fold hydrolase [Chitinophaga eiseniae]NLR77899.1 alpha/beta fold hydrolase [Chitinophaga eiseniae]
MKRLLTLLIVGCSQMVTASYIHQTTPLRLSSLVPSRDQQQKDSVVSFFFEQLGKGNWEAAREAVDPAVKDKLTAALLGSTWQQLELAYGKWVAFTNQQTIPADRMHVILAANTFARGYITFKVALSQQHKITGFFIEEARTNAPVLQSNESADSITTKDGGTLHGTLTLPPGKTAVPIVLIIAGSGPTDRNGNNVMLPLPNSASYQQLAAGLAASGIASLRYDKRRVGESQGFSIPIDQTTLNEFTTDAIAWVDHLLQDRRFIDVTVMGHSEGCLIGSKVAGERKLRRLVLLCPPGEPMSKLLAMQLKPRLSDSLNQQLDNILATLSQGNNPTTIPPDLGMLFAPSLYNFWKSTFKYVPCTLLASVKTPILLVGGSADVQVPPAQLDILHHCKPAAALLMVPGMTHTLKSNNNIGPDKNAPLPLAPELLPALVAFIKK